MPVSASSLARYFRIDAGNLSRCYKGTLSGFTKWEQALHADSWVLGAGYGRLSWQELATKVDKGQIIEIENKDGSLSYKKKR